MTDATETLIEEINGQELTNELIEQPEQLVEELDVALRAYESALEDVGPNEEAPSFEDLLSDAQVEAINDILHSHIYHATANNADLKELTQGLTSEQQILENPETNKSIDDFVQAQYDRINDLSDRELVDFIRAEVDTQLTEEIQAYAQLSATNSHGLILSSSINNHVQETVANFQELQSLERELDAAKAEWPEREVDDLTAYDKLVEFKEAIGIDREMTSKDILDEARTYTFAHTELKDYLKEELKDQHTFNFALNWRVDNEVNEFLKLDRDAQTDYVEAINESFRQDEQLMENALKSYVDNLIEATRVEEQLIERAEILESRGLSAEDAINTVVAEGVQAAQLQERMANSDAPINELSYALQQDVADQVTRALAFDISSAQAMLANDLNITLDKIAQYGELSREEQLEALDELRQFSIPEDHIAIVQAQLETGLGQLTAAEATQLQSDLQVFAHITQAQQQNIMESYKELANDATAAKVDEFVAQLKEIHLHEALIEDYQTSLETNIGELSERQTDFLLDTVKLHADIPAKSDVGKDLMEKIAIGTQFAVEENMREIEARIEDMRSAAVEEHLHEQVEAEIHKVLDAYFTENPADLANVIGELYPESNEKLPEAVKLDSGTPYVDAKDLEYLSNQVHNRDIREQEPTMLHDPLATNVSQQTGNFSQSEISQPNVTPENAESLLDGQTKSFSTAGNGDGSGILDDIAQKPSEELQPKDAVELANR